MQRRLPLEIDRQESKALVLDAGSVISNIAAKVSVIQFAHLDFVPRITFVASSNSPDGVN
jgi:hypothetical protein